MENNQKAVHTPHNSQVSGANNPKNWYDRHYKIILIIPVLLLIVSLAYLFIFYQKNGDFISKDVSLTGGTTITVYDQSADIGELQSSLKSQFPDITSRIISDIRTGKQEGFFIETKSDAPTAKSALEKYLGYNLTTDNSSIEFSGSSL